MLKVTDLDVFYGTIQALHGVSLSVDAGEVVTLVGANGAGKTTLLRAISGVVPPRGRVEFAGSSIAGLAPEAIVRKGIVQVPEGRRIFPGLSVIENLEVAAYALRHPEAQIRGDVDRVLTLFPPLKDRAKAYGWSLSGGEQQMLAIGRGLMARPRLLLLDEPSLGLAPLLVEEVFRVIAEIGGEGTPILLVEQNARMALRLAHRCYVMENGRVVREGTGEELLHDASVVAAYLGPDVS
jgi:branched-chain amino acid transport system ATP-binding protein